MPISPSSIPFGDENYGRIQACTYSCRLLVALQFNVLILKMQTKAAGTVGRGSKLKHVQGEGSNWVLIVGGAVLSTVSIKIGCKLKQILDKRQSRNTYNSFKENGKSCSKRSATSPLHANIYCFKKEDDNCYHCLAGMSDGGVDVKQVQTSPMSKDGRPSLPLVKVQATEPTSENGIMWASSPDCLELPPKPFPHSNSSDSPCVSDSGSDVFSKREVIQKLRQQLKRRDEMIMDMQTQITNLQNSLASQMTHSVHLQSQIDSANRDLFDSEREIQRLRKAIADHCVAESESSENHVSAPKWHSDMNGHTNGYVDGVNGVELHCNGVDKGRDGERVELLRREVQELKEVIEGKEFLLQSYKEQKIELSSKVKELQLKLSPQVPNIL